MIESNPHSVDTKKYLRELINDYENKLNSSFWSNLYPIIKEEKYKCMKHLRKIKEQEIERIFKEKTFAYQFHITS